MAPLHIPIDFQFLRSQARWRATSASITGWARRTDGTVDTGLIKATVVGLQTSIRLESHRLPATVLESCLEVGSSAADAQIQDLCKDVHLEMLANEIPQLEPDFRDKAGSTAKQDAWAMRGEFVEMQRDQTSLLAFLNKWGRWDQSGVAFPRDIVALQVGTRRDLLFGGHRPSAIVWNLPRLSRTKEYPYFAIRTTSCKIAIQTTVLSDFLNGNKYGVCARSDCRRFFPIVTRHTRQYCEQYCAHLESIRRRRAKARADKRSK